MKRIFTSEWSVFHERMKRISRAMKRISTSEWSVFHERMKSISRANAYFTSEWSVFTSEWSVFTSEWSVFTREWSVFHERMKRISRANEAYFTRNESVFHARMKRISRANEAYFTSEWSVFHTKQDASRNIRGFLHITLFAAALDWMIFIIHRDSLAKNEDWFILSSCFKPLRVSFFCWTQKKIFWRMLSPLTSIVWTKITWKTQCSPVAVNKLKHVSNHANGMLKHTYSMLNLYLIYLNLQAFKTVSNFQDSFLKPTSSFTHLLLFLASALFHRATECSKA